jgi:hypothetical protein
MEIAVAARKPRRSIQCPSGDSDDFARFAQRMLELLGQDRLRTVREHAAVVVKFWRRGAESNRR